MPTIGCLLNEMFASETELNLVFAMESPTVSAKIKMALNLVKLS